MDRRATAALPQLSGRPVVTDGGLETDLIYHHGVDLPDFAAFPLVDDERGRELLLRYYGEYVDIAERAGAGAAAGDADVAGERRLGRPARLLRRRASPGQPRRGDAARSGCATRPASRRC